MSDDVGRLGSTAAAVVGVLGVGIALFSAVAPALAVALALAEALDLGPDAFFLLVLALDFGMPALWFVSGVLVAGSHLVRRSWALVVVWAGLLALSILEMLVVYAFSAVACWALNQGGSYIW